MAQRFYPGTTSDATTAPRAEPIVWDFIKEETRIEREPHKTPIRALDMFNDYAAVLYGPPSHSFYKKHQGKRLLDYKRIYPHQVIIRLKNSREVMLTGQQGWTSLKLPPKSYLAETFRIFGTQSAKNFIPSTVGIDSLMFGRKSLLAHDLKRLQMGIWLGIVIQVQQNTL